MENRLGADELAFCEEGCGMPTLVVITARCHASPGGIYMLPDCAELVAGFVV
jgi:hypothetical protein